VVIERGEVAEILIGETAEFTQSGIDIQVAAADSLQQ
jgi:hypothetical protein